MKRFNNLNIVVKRVSKFFKTKSCCCCWYHFGIWDPIRTRYEEDMRYQDTWYTTRCETLRMQHFTIFAFWNWVWEQMSALNKHLIALTSQRFIESNYLMSYIISEGRWVTKKKSKNTDLFCDRSADEKFNFFYYYFPTVWWGVHSKTNCYRCSLGKQLKTYIKWATIF